MLNLTNYILQKDNRENYHQIPINEDNKENKLYILQLIDSLKKYIFNK